MENKFEESFTNVMIALLERWKINTENKTSSFGKRVIVKETYRVLVVDGKDEENKDTHNLKWKGIVIDPNDNSIISEAEIVCEEQMNVDILTQERLELFMSIALSGIYCTPYDVNAAMSSFGKSLTYGCDECGQFFDKDIDSFVEHLKITKHKDGIFEKYPHWKI